MSAVFVEGSERPASRTRVLSEAQAAEFLGVSRATVTRLRLAGELSFCRIGSRVVYRESDLEEFLATRNRRMPRRR